MKKIVLFFFFLMMPTFVSAYSNYDIAKESININIQSNGNLKVKEYIVLSGTTTYLEKDIIYKNSRLSYHSPMDLQSDALYNASGIDDDTVSVASYVTNTKLDKLSYQKLTKAYYDNDAVNKEYTTKMLQNGKSYHIYNEVKDETVVYLFEYTILDAIVYHNDIAELQGFFIDDILLPNTNEVTINITLPGKDMSEKFRLWVRSLGTTETHYTNNDTVQIHSLKGKPVSTFDFRLIFSNNLVNEVIENKRSHIDAYQNIVDLEQEDYRTKKEDLEESKERKSKLDNICLGVILLLSITFICFLLKFRENPKKIVASNTFLPSKNIECTEYLINKKITKASLIVSLINLIFKGNIVVNCNKKDISLNLDNSKNTTISEEMLLSFLFEHIGKNNTFTLQNLTNYINDLHTKTSFNAFFTSWQRCVTNESINENFYEKTGLPIITAIFYLLITIFIMLASFYFAIETWSVWLLLVESILLLIYTLKIKKRTPNALEAYISIINLKKKMKVSEELNYSQEESEKVLLYACLFKNVKIVETKLLAANNQNKIIKYHLASQLEEMILNHKN